MVGCPQRAPQPAKGSAAVGARKGFYRGGRPQSARKAATVTRPSVFVAVRQAVLV